MKKWIPYWGIQYIEKMGEWEFLFYTAYHVFTTTAIFSAILILIVKVIKGK